MIYRRLVAFSVVDTIAGIIAFIMSSAGVQYDQFKVPLRAGKVGIKWSVEQPSLYHI
jgi:hypothetical protein